MQNTIYILLRRMRMPLSVLVAVYALSTLGLVLIPGIDDQGNPWNMSFFHAFYFVSFMGTTIGFGEIPYPFTDPQRLWTMACIYTTVIAWLYAIGTLLTIFQDPGFRELRNRNAFQRAVHLISERFYIVCGYGDTGSLLVRELTEHGITCVVIDANQERISHLKIEDLPLYVPGSCSDVDDPHSLEVAGLQSALCQGVIAVTNSDDTNLKVAISTKLMRPRLPVICRADTQDTTDNMASFKTDFIVNPHETFVERFGRMMHSPGMYMVDDWITSMRGTALREFVQPPLGRWVLCGHGNLGRPLRQRLIKEGCVVTVIEIDPNNAGAPADTIYGRGTEAVTLNEANIREATGIIAASNNDTNNLSILMTARDLNPKLFTIGKRNLERNQSIFDAANIDIIVQPSNIVARRILTLVLEPLLADFRRLSGQQDEAWANVLIARVSGVVTDRAPGVWTLKVRLGESPALTQLLSEECTLTMGQLVADPRNCERRLACLPLLLKRGVELRLMPDDEIELEIGDEILFCGIHEAETLMRWSAENFNILSYICHGSDQPSGSLWRWLTKSATDHA